MAKTPKGELTGAELRKLIRAHNILVSIKIPKGTDREGLIKLIEGKGYKVDHKKKAIIDAKKDRPRRPKVTLEKAKEVTKPKPKTELQKQKAAEAKAEKAEKKKKEERAIKKEAIKGVMDRKKALKQKSIENNKEDMPKPKQPKTTQKLKSQKVDEVRPKEKVGRPKVDPKKIKVIQPKPKVSDAKKKEAPKPKKVKGRFGYDAFKKQLDKAVEVSGQSLDNLTKKSKERLAEIEKELKDGTNKRETLSITIGKSQIKPTGSAVSHPGDKFNLTIKFGLNEGEELTRQTKRGIPRAKILPFEKSKNDKGKPSEGFSKERILEVFKAIMKNYTAILQDKNDTEGVKISKAIEKLLSQGKMTFENPQKEVIVKAIPAYLDLIPMAGNTEQIAIAKQLQKKYK